MGEVGREVRRLREERGWGQAKLAVEAGMAVSGVSQIENGKRNPNSATLLKLARALGVEVADLFPKAQAPLPLDDASEALSEEERIEQLVAWAGLCQDFARHYRDELEKPGAADNIFWLFMQATLTYLGALKAAEDELHLNTSESDLPEERDAEEKLRSALNDLYQAALAINAAGEAGDTFREQRAMITSLSEFR